MKVVYKYPLPHVGINEIFQVLLPVDSKIVHFGVDGLKQYCIWAETDPDRKGKSGQFFIWLFTGHHAVPENYGHFQTVIDPDGIVLHLYREHVQ